MQYVYAYVFVSVSAFVLHSLNCFYKSEAFLHIVSHCFTAFSFPKQHEQMLCCVYVVCKGMLACSSCAMPLTVFSVSVCATA